jgi:uncharacterized protein YukE
MIFQEPPRPAGRVEEQLEKQYAYLFQMAQQLNVALSQLDGEMRTIETSVPTAQDKAKQAQDNKAQVQNLRSLIVKSADEVNAALDTVRQTMSGNYVAQSDFGTYVQKLNATIEGNAAAITQYYSFYGDLKSNTDSVSSAFENYRTQTEGYIRTGIVEYQEDGTPVYGVAVGQGLSTKDVTLTDGTVATEIERKQFRSVFTAQKLSFYQDEREVAYLSNQRLYITDAQITGRLYLGENWELAHDNGLTLKWIGGEV